MDTNLIGKCGLYCGACFIYRAERDDQALRKQIADHYKCKEAEVRCHGCGGLSESCWGNGCKIVICVGAKGFKTCYECENFHNDKCDKFHPLYQSYRAYGVDLKTNLKRINSGDAEAWLADSEARFRCSACGHPIHVGAKACPECGKELAI